MSSATARCSAVTRWIAIGSPEASCATPQRKCSGNASHRAGCRGWRRAQPQSRCRWRPWLGGMFGHGARNRTTHLRRPPRALPTVCRHPARALSWPPRPRPPAHPRPHPQHQLRRPCRKCSRNTRTIPTPTAPSAGCSACGESNTRALAPTPARRPRSKAWNASPSAAHSGSCGCTITRRFCFSTTAPVAPIRWCSRASTTSARASIWAARPTTSASASCRVTGSAIS